MKPQWEFIITSDGAIAQYAIGNNHMRFIYPNFADFYAYIMHNALAVTSKQIEMIVLELAAWQVTQRKDYNDEQ